MKPNAVWWVLVKLHQEGRCESLLLCVYEGEWKDGNYIESCKKKFWRIIWGRLEEYVRDWFLFKVPAPFLKEDHHSHFTVRTWEYFFVKNGEMRWFYVVDVSEKMKKKVCIWGNMVLRVSYIVFSEEGWNVLWGFHEKCRYLVCYCNEVSMGKWVE